MGIAIFGLNGAGKSTLTHAVAKETGYYEIDVEDYYFPEQRESRKQALEQAENIDTGCADELPYSKPRSKAEVQEALLEAVKAHPDFILAGVNLNWCEEILLNIEIAFWVKVELKQFLCGQNQVAEFRLKT